MPCRSRIRQLPRPLDVEQILVWADAHFARTGKWPLATSGPIGGTLNETWAKVDRALQSGYRGLVGGSSLPRLLEERRGVRHRLHLPNLLEAAILGWADAHFSRTGAWPDQYAGPVADAPGETWRGINHALRLGYRGFAGGSSLAELLQQQRGVRNVQNLPDYSLEAILRWADLHFARTGCWPTANTSAIVDTPGETWKAVQMALVAGRRGLPGGSSLCRLLQANGRSEFRPRQSRRQGPALVPIAA